MNKKTKKILLLISTILALLLNISSIYAIYSEGLEVVEIEDIIQITPEAQITALSICAIINLISIVFINKNLITHKKKLIIFNVIQLLFGNMINIVSGIFNIILLSIKTKGIEEEIKEKKQLPVLEDITKHKWYIYFIIFVFLFAICYTPVSNLLPIPDTKIASLISMILLYIIQVVLLVIPMANELKRDFLAFKNNFKLYLGKMLPRFGLILIAYFLSSSVLILFIKNIPTNQAILNSLPIYITAFLAIIVGPLTEELMFRGFIKKFIKNDILFVIFSSLIFGALHVTLADSFHQLLFIIPYSILGFAFSMNYVKTRNIVSNIFLHSAWNSIAVIGMIISNFL